MPFTRSPAPPTSDADTATTGRSAPTFLRVRAVVCLIGGSGLVLVVLGSFLPWVVSGTVRRSSYQIAGVVSRLGIGEGGVLAMLIGVWPLLGVLCVLPVLAAAVRWWRTSGIIAVLIGLQSGLLSFGLSIFAASRSGAMLRVDPIGPAVMAAGSVLLFCAGIALFVRVGSPVRRTRLDHCQTISNDVHGGVQPND